MSETTTEIAIEQPLKKVAGFAKRNMNQERINREEEELKSLMNLSDEEGTEEQENSLNSDDDSMEPKSAEEKTFKKRYGDLRRHSQKKEQEFQKQIDDLRRQLETSTKETIKYPKSEQELDNWMKQYPDVAKIVETIAMKKAKEQASEFESKFKQIDDMKMEAMREKAEAELMRLHPDFDVIRDSDEFHDWVEDQPKWIQDALYDNDNDARSAARAIDLYKADMGISTKKPKSDRDAAKSVNTKNSRSKPQDEGSATYLKESAVQRMSPQEYEKNSDEIMEAIRSGKFIYDVSGSAR